MVTATKDPMLSATVTGSWPRPRWYDGGLWGRPLDTALLDVKFREQFLDAHSIMAHIADDAVFEGPRGADPWGTRFVGSAAIREAFAARFAGIPDVRYQDDAHFVDGDRGVSEWTLSGTMTTGERIEVRGCDLWTFCDGKIVKKDSFWKIQTTG